MARGAAGYIYIYIYVRFVLIQYHEQSNCMRRIIVGKVSLSLSLSIYIYIYYMSYKHYADSNLDWTLLESYRSLGGVRKETEWNMNGI